MRDERDQAIANLPRFRAIARSRTHARIEAEMDLAALRGRLRHRPGLDYEVGVVERDLGLAIDMEQQADVCLNHLVGLIWPASPEEIDRI